MTDDTRRHLLRKEMVVGLLNGLIWGGLAGITAGLFYGRLALGVVMMAAIILNLMIAAAVGVLVPSRCIGWVAIRPRGRASC